MTLLQRARGIFSSCCSICSPYRRKGSGIPATARNVSIKDFRWAQVAAGGKSFCRGRCLAYQQPGTPCKPPSPSHMAPCPGLSHLGLLANQPTNQPTNMVSYFQQTMAITWRYSIIARNWRMGNMEHIEPIPGINIYVVGCVSCLNQLKTSHNQPGNRLLRCQNWTSLSPTKKLHVLYLQTIPFQVCGRAAGSFVLPS